MLPSSEENLHSLAVTGREQKQQQQGGRGGGVKTKKYRLPVREVRVELCGAAGHEAFEWCFSYLRRMRTRYTPLLRTYFTAVVLPKELLYMDDPPVIGVLPPHVDDETTPSSSGGNNNNNNAEEAVLSSCFTTRTVAALTFDRYPALARLTHHDSTAHATTTVVVTSSEDDRRHSTHWLQEFMEETFLSLALHRTVQQALSPESPPTAFDVVAVCRQDTDMPHHRPLLSSLSTWSLYLKHYVNEANRTCSFLIADFYTRRAVIIDPSLDLDAYERDLAKHQLILVGVCLTHLYLDIRTGHKMLLDAHPTARLFWYQSLVKSQESSGATMASSSWDVTTLSDRFSLTARHAPTVCPEGLIFELWCSEGVRLAVFSGPSMPLDGLPRSDLRSWITKDEGAASSSSSVTATAMPTTPTTTVRPFECLRQLFAEYFGGSFQYSPRLDATIVFPSHGGYSHMTHQLDLHWCAHIADLKRFTHVKKMYDCVCRNDEAAYDTLMESLPKLPIGPLFSANRSANALDCGAAAVCVKTEPALSAPSTLIVVDTRPFSDYVASHMCGSINIPMTFPGAAFGAKKAELWLECCMRPGVRCELLVRQDDDALVAKEEALRRVLAIGVEDVVAVSVADVADENRWVIAASSSATALSTDASEVATTSAEVTTATPMVTVGWKRLASVASLDCITPDPSTLVVDVRTDYEFKNGSHRNSVHVPLADLCAMFSSLGDPSRGGAIAMLDHIHEKAIANGVDIHCGCRRIKKVIFYCAAGYRSHIAVSLLRASLELQQASAAEQQELREGGELPPPAPSWGWKLNELEVADVAGGALHIMMYRPDVWLVKDRSIVCIS